ncbi:MAG: ferredoxin--NADP reductase [Candidatus Saccharimonadaceae bacterium]
MKYDALVTRVVKESSHISTVFFTIDGGVFPYIAGQYISIYFEQTGLKSGKAYSLSSAPNDPELSVTVKNIGEFSGLICALKVGEHLQASSPFGFFNAGDDAPIVAIAAGVGIAPIWSIIRDELNLNGKRSITLYLSAPKEEELVFRSAVDELFAKSTNTKAYYFVTQQEPKYANHRRFAVTTDLSKKTCTTARFYICGSQSFVSGIWTQLMEAGVDEQRVVTETFFESSL